MLTFLTAGNCQLYALPPQMPCIWRDLRYAAICSYVSILPSYFLRKRNYLYRMKSLLTLWALLLCLVACRQQAEAPFHACVVRELIQPVSSTDTVKDSAYSRTRIRCAGKCQDGAPCDSTIELTNTSMGASVRRVRCGCAGESPEQDCGLIIEHIRHSPDSIVSRLYCAHGPQCSATSGSCQLQEHQLPDDTIRSTVTGGDSLIVHKWLCACMCMESGRG